MDGVLIMPAVSAASAWCAVAAWAGFMVGVGAALRPSAPVWMDPIDSARSAEAWAPYLAGGGSAPSRPQLLISAAGECRCDVAAQEQLIDWAGRSALDVRTVADAPAGVALVDSRGRLRYAGEAGALVSSCAGMSGFKRWWAAVPGDTPAAARFTAPCGCLT